MPAATVPAAAAAMPAAATVPTTAATAMPATAAAMAATTTAVAMLGRRRTGDGQECCARKRRDRLQRSLLKEAEAHEAHG